MSVLLQLYFIFVVSIKVNHIPSFYKIIQNLKDISPICHRMAIMLTINCFSLRSLHGRKNKLNQIPKGLI